MLKFSDVVNTNVILSKTASFAALFYQQALHFQRLRYIQTGVLIVRLNDIYN